MCVYICIYHVLVQHDFDIFPSQTRLQKCRIPESRKCRDLIGRLPRHGRTYSRDNVKHCRRIETITPNWENHVGELNH